MQAIDESSGGIKKISFRCIRKRSVQCNVGGIKFRNFLASVIDTKTKKLIKGESRKCRKSILVGSYRISRPPTDKRIERGSVDKSIKFSTAVAHREVGFNS